MQDWPLIWRIAVPLATLALSTLVWAALRIWDRRERARWAEPDEEATRRALLRNLPPTDPSHKDAR